MLLELKRSFKATAVAAVLLATTVLPAHAAFIIYENLPTNESHQISHHGVGGPILADDFVPAAGGLVTQVEWWGSAAPDENWELAFHTNNVILGQPNIDNPFSGAFAKYFVIANGVQDVIGHPEIWHYSVNLVGGPVLNAGQEYWFTTANFSDGWTWADALSGPTVGSENFNVHNSIGNICGDGGPHCGAWTDVHTDTAFRVSAVPEPETYVMLLAGLGLLGFMARRRKVSAA